MNWSGKDWALTPASVNNIKKAFRTICKEQDITMDEMFNRDEERRFNVFDFANEYGENVTYEQAYDFINKYMY